MSLARGLRCPCCHSCFPRQKCRFGTELLTLRHPSDLKCLRAYRQESNRVKEINDLATRVSGIHHHDSMLLETIQFVETYFVPDRPCAYPFDPCVPWWNCPHGQILIPVVSETRRMRRTMRICCCQHSVTNSGLAIRQPCPYHLFEHFLDKPCQIMFLGIELVARCVCTRILLRIHGWIIFAVIKDSLMIRVYERTWYVSIDRDAFSLRSLWWYELFAPR